MRYKNGFKETGRELAIPRPSGWVFRISELLQGG